MNNIFTKERFGLLFIVLLFHGLAYAQSYKNLGEAKGLPVGAKAPLFTAIGQDDKSYSLANALKKGPVVLLFYRGQWCPVCNRHLNELQDSLQQVYDKGATVVAISPERPEFLKMTEKKTKAAFTLLHDKDYKIEDAFDVTYRAEDAIIEKYISRLNARLNIANSDNSNRLPIPATFIIDGKGLIVWRQFNPDYHIRASVQDIINNQ